MARNFDFFAKRLLLCLEPDNPRVVDQSARCSETEGGRCSTHAISIEEILYHPQVLNLKFLGLFLFRQRDSSLGTFTKYISEGETVTYTLFSQPKNVGKTVSEFYFLVNFDFIFSNFKNTAKNFRFTVRSCVSAKSVLCTTVLLYITFRN